MRAEHMACDAQSTAPEREGRIARRVAIGLMAFLTLVDLFAAQAILPTLAAHYQVSASAMGIATNACTLGMAVAGLAVASFSMRIDRRAGIVASLVVLALPTLLLAHAPNLAAFAALRIVQGLCMATAFALTLAHLGERFRAALSGVVVVLPLVPVMPTVSAAHNRRNRSTSLTTGISPADSTAPRAARRRGSVVG